MDRRKIIPDETLALCCCLVTKSCQILWPHRPQHTSLLCPQLSPGVYSSLCPFSLMPSNHLILCCPFLLPSNFPSIRFFSSESALQIRWPKYWNFSFSISPSNEYSGLISLRNCILLHRMWNGIVSYILCGGYAYKRICSFWKVRKGKRWRK